MTIKLAVVKKTSGNQIVEDMFPQENSTQAQTPAQKKTKSILSKFPHRKPKFPKRKLEITESTTQAQTPADLSFNPK